jgi:hypothetical protein
VEFAEIPRFKRCSTGPSKAVSVTLIPLDFGEKGVYASYTHDNPPTELNLPLGTATAPPRLEGLDAHGGGNYSYDLGIPLDFLP